MILGSVYIGKNAGCEAKAARSRSEVTPVALVSLAGRLVSPGPDSPIYQLMRYLRDIR